MKGRIIGSGEKTRYVLDGQDVTKAEFDRAFPDKPLGGSAGLIGWKPLASDAMAVHPSQVAEASEDARKKGVPVDFLPDGRPVFTSRQQRAAYCRAYGVFDRGAGYGDAQYNGKQVPEPDPKDYLEC